MKSQPVVVPVLSPKKTWGDVEFRSLNDPIIHQVMRLIHRGDFSREEALIAAVLALSDVRESQQKAMVDMLNRCVCRGVKPLAEVP